MFFIICCRNRVDGGNSWPLNRAGLSWAQGCLVISMAGYYAYIFDHEDHIKARVEIITDTDSEARRLAKQLADGHAVELWEASRKVERFEPDRS